MDENKKSSWTVPAEEIETDYSKISRNSFPDDFIFGTGTSAYQHEGGASKGGRGQSIWDVFTLRTPGRIIDGSNGNVAVDMFSKYEEDIKMMKSMGFDSYRFSISWPRILPGGRLCLGVNKEGINFYNNIINTLIANGIEPFVTLFHWDLPLSLEQEYGGFLSKNIVNDFREFAELCFWEFGDRVKNWVTLNEPWTYCVHGYAGCIFPPSKGPNPALSLPNNRGINLDKDASLLRLKLNRVSHRTVHDVELLFPFNLSISDESNTTSNPAKDVYTAARNMLLAHAEAVQSYRTKFQERQKGQIGITLVCHWFEPLTSSNIDKKAAKRALDFMIGWFLEPVLSGNYPENMTTYVPKENLDPFSEQESELLKGSIDFLGLNYYTAIYAADDEPYPDCKHGYDEDQHVAFYTERNGKPIGQVAGSSWLYIVPWGIHKLLKYINNTYNNNTYNLPPIYITENGVDEKNDRRLTANDACRDKIRVHYHQDHLGNVLKAINEKVNVKGYFAWSWCDNFEWVEGYTVRFGLIYIDYMNYLTRQPKDSAIWFSKFLVKKKKIPPLLRR